ncbi:quinone oxidoreductase-like protein 1 [Gigantopelta aegis]|uniref:quinone oxidoreductase-like protein 1 n=1 Tax=Gigantopelta aegis TaxID=1735272 RepID=UPI001B88E00F|nr:quinone oxidoreductase-like protein 1 [Gigantopelta aegis]
MMRCIRRSVCHDGHVVKFTEENVEIPKAGDNEIVVKVKACGLSYVKNKVLSEMFKKVKLDSCIAGEDVSGVVTQVGVCVTSFQEGDAVVGILPLDSCFSGCGEYCVFAEYDLVKKPEHVEFVDAAATIGDCVRAYTALHYQAQVCAGDTLLVLDGATSFGSIAVQLAQQWGAKVMSTYSSPAERQHLECMQPPVAQVIELSKKNNILVSSVMEETGGVGIDCVVDNGVRMFTNEEDIALQEESSPYPQPHKNDVISCLGFGGKWITSQPDLQLDPPDTQQLFLRGASVNFLFHQAWVLTSAQQGRYQHILQDSMDKLDKGLIRCKIAKTVTFDEVLETMQSLEDVRLGKVVLKM